MCQQSEGGEGGRTHTMKITLAINCQTPASMLCKRMQHMVQKSNPSINTNRLGLRRLTSMTLKACSQSWINIGWEVPAVQVDGHLDLGLVSVASDGCPAWWVLYCGGHECGLW